MQRLVIGFLASFLIWFLYAGLVLLWFIDGKIKKEQVIHALVASFFAWITSEILKELFNTDRPFTIDGSQIMTLTIPKDAAFPSAHAAVVFALSTTVWLHDRKVGWIFLILALAVGVARILANVHYPQDIFGGAILGIFVSFIVEKIHFRDIFRK